MPRHPPNAQKNKQQNTTKHTDKKAHMPQSQKQYSNNARVHYTVHNQPTHTHNPTPQQRSRITGQATRAHYPRTPTACHPHTRKHHARESTHHHQNRQQRACLLHQHPATSHPHPRHTSEKQEQQPAAFRRSSPGRPRPPTAQTTTNDQEATPTQPILRKEVIQPHLPVRLPCYDFVPIANPTFDHSPRKNG